jgi:hypothetical protein
VLTLAFWLVRCAGQLPPPGGDPDRVPPQIVRTEPDTNAVRVETDRVVLEFSEHVDRRSVEQSVFISPWPGEVEYDWSGTEVTILFPSPLRANRTYVVNLGTDVIDRRERNRMASGFALAFSTGDSIDHGFITGRVYDEKPEGVMVFAYQLDAINPDTLNPAALRPDYITQTGHDGTFTLANLALGAYRVVAIRDEFRDMLYARNTDQYGVPARDVVLRSDRDRVEGLGMRLALEDTAHPFLTTVQPLTRGALLVRFSEPIDSMSLATMELDVADTLSGVPVLTREPYLIRDNAAMLMVPLEAEKDSGAVLRLRIRGLADRAGNPLDSSTASAIITMGGVRDTAAPSWVIVGVKDSLRGYPLDRPLHFTFSKPVDRDAAMAGIGVVDSARRPVEYFPRWSGPADVDLVFSHPLMSRHWYEIRITLDSLRDVRGNARRDSTTRLRIQTFDLKSAGTIEGWVRDSAGGTGAFTVLARSVGTPDVLERRVHLPQPGLYQITDLPEGLYTIWGYRDVDSSGSYSFGLPYPYRRSEPFTVLAETVKVRARWGVEGAGLNFR